MASAVLALATPLLLLTFSLLLNDSEPPEIRLPDPARQEAAEEVLRGVLASQRSEEQDEAFRRYRELAERFTSAAASNLRHISPLFAGAVVANDGGAYEDTRVSEAADFDMYTLMAAAPLRQFELLRGADRSFTVRLRPGATRDELPEDLLAMLTEDGRLDGHRFRTWTTECVMWALREAAKERPDLRPVVYATHNAPGVSLTAADGVIVEIDFTAKLPLPPTQPPVLRPAALRPCGTSLISSTEQPPFWHLYSATSSGAEPGRFSAEAPQLELRLLRAAPLLRDVIRLLKTLRAVHNWYHRFNVMSFHLKQAALWSREERCEETGLLHATVAALRRLERALHTGRLEYYWFAEPAENVLNRRVAAPQLAEEVAACVETLTNGDPQRIRRLFQL